MQTKILLAAVLLMTLVKASAEEQPSPVLTAISSTTISGYVNVLAHWKPGSPALRFEDLRGALRERGFAFKRSGKHYFFYKGKLALYLCKQGPFARRSDILQVRRLLRGA